MEKIILGKSGIEVSRLCFGSLTLGPLQAKLPLEEGGEIMRHAISRGINFTDTAELYQTYPYIRRGMELSGKYDLVVSSKTYAYTRELAVAAVEQARRELNRDYIDIFMLHEQESCHTLRGHREALEYLYECKQKGMIRAVGASMHHIAAVEGAIDIDLDVIHPLINLVGLGIVDGSREEMEVALQKAFHSGIGIFSMKPLGGGNLHKNATQCLRYILAQPYIHSIAIGMQSIAEVDANIDFLQNLQFDEAALNKLNAANRKIHIDDWCEACGNCVERCGQNAMSIKGNMAVCDHDKCILCGYCSTVCPAWAIKVV